MHESIPAMLVAACLVSLGGCQRPAPAPPPAPPFNTTIPLHDLMVHVIDPNTDVVWAASGVILLGFLSVLVATLLTYPIASEISNRELVKMRAPKRPTKRSA